MTPQQEIKIRNFKWDVGCYMTKEIRFKAYIKFINRLLRKEKEKQQEDIQSVINMLEGDTKRQEIIKFIKEYL